MYEKNNKLKAKLKNIFYKTINYEENDGQTTRIFPSPRPINIWLPLWVAETVYMGAWTLLARTTLLTLWLKKNGENNRKLAYLPVNNDNFRIKWELCSNFKNIDSRDPSVLIFEF